MTEISKKPTKPYGETAIAIVVEIKGKSKTFYLNNYDPLCGGFNPSRGFCTQDTTHMIEAWIKEQITKWR